MILLYEVAKAGPFTTVYRDSDDPNLFYYCPEFSALRVLPNGRIIFGATLFKKDPAVPNDGFSLYNFGVKATVPNEVLTTTRDELIKQYGPNISLQSVPSQNPSLEPLTPGIYTDIRCQANGGNIHTDPACSFRVPEDLEPTLAQSFQQVTGWVGAVNYRVRTRKTAFKWKITANWHVVQEHFKAQASVQYWWVKSNISYETQRLLMEDKLHIDIVGGTPGQKEKVYTFAEKIAQRLFVKTLDPAPLPGHPSGAIVCLSINYSKVEENKVSEWSGEEADFEERDMSLAVYVREVPREYFVGFDKNSTPIAQPAPDYPKEFSAGLVIPKKYA